MIYIIIHYLKYITLTSMNFSCPVGWGGVEEYTDCISAEG